jgi:VWFA-related protein
MYSLAVSLETRTCGLLAGLLAVTLAVAIPASGQQPSPSTQSRSAAQTSSAPRETKPEVGAATVLKATTRMVVLDVVVGDKRGDPIPNLEAADFRVLEQGQEQSIRVFELKQPAAGISALPTALKYPPNVFSNVQFARRPAALNVILLDALNTNLQDQMRTRLQMLRFLKTMPAGQPIAIYTLTRDLHLLQDFTSDPNLLLEVATNYRAKDLAVSDNPTDGIPPVDALAGNPLAAGLIENMQTFRGAPSTRWQLPCAVRGSNRRSPTAADQRKGRERHASAARGLTIEIATEM